MMTMLFLTPRVEHIQVYMYRCTIFIQQMSNTFYHSHLPCLSLAVTSLSIKHAPAVRLLPISVKWKLNNIYMCSTTLFENLKLINQGTKRRAIMHTV